MGNVLFDTDIAALIADAFDGQLLDVVVTKLVRGARAAGNLTGGPQTSEKVFEGAQGFWEDYTGTPPPGVEVLLNDRRAFIIGDTIPAGGLPERNDAVTIEGQTLYVVRLESRDPAAAGYRFQCRDRRGPDGA